MSPNSVSRILALMLVLVPAAAVWGVDLAPVDVDSLLREARTRSYDSSYDYVYVLDKMDTDLRADYTYDETYHGIYLVLSTEGLRDLGTLTASHRLGYDSLTIDVARIHAPDGTVTDLTEADILRGVTPSHLMANNLYTDRRQTRVLYKNVQVGSMVEFKHTQHRLKVDVAAFSTFFLHQMRKPALLSQNAIRYPASLPVKATERLMIHGPEKQAVDSHSVLIWTSRDVPAFENEPGALPLNDLIPGVYITTLEDWSACAALMYRSFWQQDLKTPLGECERALLDQLNLEAAPPLERLKAIYYALQKDVRYLGLEVGVNNLKPHESAVICANGYGDCKDKSNLLIKLLAHEGIKSVPALVATRDRTLNVDSTTPAYALFNHAIVYVPDLDGQAYWLDPTLNHASAGWLPPAIHHAFALLLDSTTTGPLRRIPLTPAALDREEVRGRMTLDPGGGAHIDGRRTLTGFKSHIYKTRFAAMSGDQIGKMMISGISSSSPGARLIDYHTSGLEQFDSAFTMAVEYSDAEYAQRAGNLLIVGGKKDRRYSSEFDNSGYLEHRSLDLYLGWQPSFRWVTTLVLPDGFAVKSMLKDTVRTCDFVHFARAVQDFGDSLMVTVDLKVLDPLIPTERYTEYRSFINELDALGKEALVLEGIE